MISIDLCHPKMVTNDQLIWQLKTQWIGKPLISCPTSLHLGIGIQVPKNFGKIKKKQALNQMISPTEDLNISIIIDIYTKLLENIVVQNKNQFYKISIEKFYSEKSYVKILLQPNEGNLTTAERVL